MKRSSSVAVLAAVVALALVGAHLPLPGWAPPARAEESVRLGYLSVISFAPVYLAEDQGFLKEQGLKVEYERFVSGSKMVAPLATDRLNISAGSISAGFFNSLAQGSDFVVVADKGQFRLGYGFNHIVVRKDLVDSGRVKSLKDLKGMKVAPNAPMNILTYFLGNGLEEAGMTLNDVEIVFVDFPKMPAALQNKAVDAVVSGEPWGARIQKLGFGVRLLSTEDVKATREAQGAVIMYSGKFARERRGTAQKYMNAYLKAVRFYNEHGMKAPQVLDVLEKWTKVPRDIIEASIPFYLDKDAMPHTKSLMEMQAWFHAKGAVKTMVPLERIVDLSFVKAAAAK